MRRIQIQPRTDWKKKLEDISFEFHSLDDIYWDESAYYEFSMKQVDVLEKASNDLYEMCLKAVQYVIDNHLYQRLCIDENMIPLIVDSWEEEYASVYGRFDLAYDGIHPPKMLEFNADTPTTLYEGAVVQWQWLQDIMKEKDQFNSIHERLIDYWKGCVDYFGDNIVYFTSVDSIEDFTTTEYLRDTASQAGVKTEYIKIEDIGWDSETEDFVDIDNNPVPFIFKLYDSPQNLLIQ